MDEWFIKSALPALLTHDSSLALPAEPSPISLDRAGPNDRNRRVQQQVQLTLARRSRRTGSVHLHRNAAKSFDAADRPPPHMKVNGLGFTNHSLTSNHVRKPSRRVEVSPPRTPASPTSRFNRTAFFYGTYSHPGPCQPQRRCLLPDHSFISDSFRPYAFSEARGVPQFQASTAPAERFDQKSVRCAAAPQAAYANTMFQQSTRRGSSRSYRRSVVEEERPIAQGQSADTSGAVQADNGLSWLAQVRSQGLRHRRLKSYPPTDTSVEVDMGRPPDVETLIQKTQAHSVMSLKSPDRKSPDRPPELTMEKAVNLLGQDNEEETLVSAASYIQNQCLRSDDAKKIVYYLRGIEKLLGLLCSDEETVQRAAAGALRNVVYQNNDNKMEVKDKDGLATILATLKSSRDVETRRELTGLLWNLSSHDILKESLTRQALSVLTKSVLVPSSGLSEGENPKDELLADATVFHNATGCLQNLSSAGPDGRRAMRECEDLIDSLVYYIRGAIADYKADDKSTENCVCILHNLSYQIEAELPKSYARDFGEPRQSLAPEPKALGCFAHRSAKITEHLERQRPLLEEKANPRGIEWLWSAITIRMYLSLIARSVRHCTQEAAVGALQNITAGNGALSEAITFTIVQRESGLHHVKKMLEEGEVDVKRMAVSLIRNLSRYQELHPNIVKQVLPELVEMLPDDDGDTQLPAEVTASLCHILNNLSQSDKQHVKAIVNEGALPKIISISSSDTGYGPNRASQAACVLLHTMWKHTDLHGSFKKCGYKKSDFINPRTTKAVNSAS